MDRLEGIAPVTEDWHARITLVKVMKCSYFIVSEIIYKLIINCRLFGKGFGL